MRYKADITAGSLKVRESRVIAGLLLEGFNDQDWKSALEVENVLQARTTRNRADASAASSANASRP